MKQFMANTRRQLKPGRTAKGISLTVLQPAYNALGGIPIPGAQAAVGAVLDIVKGVDATSRNSATLAELEKHIRFLTELLEPLRKIDSHNLPPGLEDEVGGLSRDLETIASKMKSISHTGGVRRFLERQDDENDLHTFAENLKQALDRFQTSQLIRQRQELHHQGQELHFQTQELLLRGLPRADNASYDSGREDAPMSCLQGTRSAILAEIMSWLESANGGGPRVYWLDGLAGMGKSTIAHTIAEQAKEKGMLGASFFFSRSDAPLRDPQLVFPTLAFQLAESNNSFKSVIGDALQEDATLGHKALLSQIEGLILTPLLKLDADRRVTLIILDALDECEEKGASAILRYLFSHVIRVPFLRILITSRPEPHISGVFSQALNSAKTVLHDIEASVVQEDIRYYISTELAKIPEKLNLRLVADWTTEDQRNSLVEKSGKLFVYAATAMRFIGDNRVRNPRRQLQLMLDTQTAQGVGRTRPYVQLDNLYMGVLLNSLSDSNRRDILERFQVVVGSIILLREPLPLLSLAEFARYDMDEIDTALYHLRSVIIPPSNDREAPRIYHPSFRDFIMDASRCSEADFVIVPVPEQERRHAIRCFELMGTFLKRDVAGISDLSVLNSEVEGFEGKVREALSPEVQYACRYWGVHLSHVELGDEGIVEALEVFSKRSILMWLEAMSLIGSISNTASSIREAHRWAMNSKCESTVVMILSDANRFIMAHGDVIRSSALHTYHSALAFTPHDTELYKTYSQGTKDPICVVQGVESQWQRNLSTLVGHFDSITSLAISPDGLRLASGSEDSTLRLWDGMSGAHIATLEGHAGWVTSVGFSPDGLRLASGSADHTIRLWDGMLGVHIATLEGHSESISSIAFSPNGLRLASGSDDNTLRLWDGMSGAHIGILEGHLHQVFSTTYSPDSLRLASADYEGTLRLWDGMSGAHIATLQGHSNLVRSITFSPNGLRLASASDDNTLRLWDGMSGMHIATLEGHASMVLSTAFSPDNLQLASGSSDETIRLWDGMSGTHVATLDGCPSYVSSVTFSPDGSRLASCHQQILWLWDAISRVHIATLDGHSGEVSSLAFLADGSRLASGSYDHTLRLWDATSSAHVAHLQAHSEEVLSVTFSLDGLRLASSSRDGILRLWDALSGALIAALEGHPDVPFAVVFSPNGLRLATNFRDCSLQLWDAVSGAHIAALEGHSLWITSLVFSPDGLRLASGSYDCTPRLWDGMTGAHIAALEEYEGPATYTLVAFSPDGSRLASTSTDFTLQLWDGMAGAHIATLQGHSSQVQTMTFSVDSRTLISHTDGGTDEQTGEELDEETFTWDLTSEPPSRVDSVPPIMSSSSLVWSKEDRWILVRHPHNDHAARVCYIPALYDSSAISYASSLPTRSHVAIGCNDGRVIILNIQHDAFVHGL